MLGRMSMTVEESIGCFADLAEESYKEAIPRKNGPKVLEKATLKAAANMLYDPTPCGGSHLNYRTPLDNCRT